MTEKKSTGAKQRKRSSSDETAASIPFEQIVSLGRKITTTFNLDRSGDMLCRWMAYRIAELIVRADQATGDAVEPAKRECTELILSLWSKRRFWPDGDPFEGSREVLKALEPPRPYESHEGAESGAVFALRRNLDRLAEAESEFLFNAALLDIDVESEKPYLADHQSLLPEEQARSIDLIIERIEAVQAGSFFGPSEPQLHKIEEAARREKIAQYLDEVTGKRISMVKEWLATEEQELIEPDGREEADEPVTGD